MLDISPVYARYLLKEFLRLGENPAALFAGTGLTPLTLQQNDSITLEEFNRVLANSRELLNDQVGLVIGRQVNVMTLGAVGVSAVSAPTLREGLQTIENFSRLHAAQTSVEVRSNLKGVNVLMHFLTDLGDVGRYHAESGALLLQSYIELIGGTRLGDAEFRMHFDEPSYAGAYGQLFHSPVSYGWPTSSLEIARHWLDGPSPYFNAELWHQSQASLGARLQERSGDYNGGYSRYVRSSLRASELPLPSLGDVASGLNMSVRTLTRRLNAESVSFRELRNEVLFEWAKRYLTETRSSVEAISAALGYEAASNFRRAFKTWTGLTPNEFRAREARAQTAR